jgi:hypothetical protein
MHQAEAAAAAALLPLTDGGKSVIYLYEYSQVMPTSASTGFIECIESTPLAVVLAEHKGDIKGFLRCTKA